MPRPAGAFQGTLHRYGKQFTAFEHSRSIVPEPKHTLIWMGGLGDGPLTVEYPITLAQRLPADWTLVEATTAATLRGWGTTTLAKDAEHLSLLVSHLRKLRSEPGKIVLMGHSTGCQDAMEYVSGPGAGERAALDGVILQASASDREGVEAVTPQDQYTEIVRAAQKLVAEGRSEDVLSFQFTKTLFGAVPVSAYRALSLLSPNKNGDDDYFSSDLSDDDLRRSFGKFTNRTPLMFLFSGNDEHVRKTIDVPAMLKRWTSFVRDAGGIVDEENGGIIEGASHNLNDDDGQIVEDLCSRVCRFLQDTVTTELHNSEPQL